MSHQKTDQVECVQSGIGQTQTRTNRNPHSAPQWPYNMGLEPKIAELLEAMYGIKVISELLSADANIRDELGDSDDPDNDPQPFNGHVRGGLIAALNALASETCDNVHSIQDFKLMKQ